MYNRNNFRKLFSRRFGEIKRVCCWRRIAWRSFSVRTDELCDSSFRWFSLGQRRIQKASHLQQKARDATGVRISESGHEGSYHPVWKLVLHTMLPSMRTAVALATASPRQLPSFKFLKPQTGCLRPIFPYERDACKTKAGACSRHGDGCG